MKRISISLFSVGWLGPMWLAADQYLEFWRGDGWLLLKGSEIVGSHQVAIPISQRCLLVGTVWLGAVIVFWSWKFSATKKPKE